MTVLPPATRQDVLIAIAYDPTGLASAEMRDFVVLGWQTGEPGAGATPIITGPLPAAPDTAPIVSPAWGLIPKGTAAITMPTGERHAYLVEFFDWLASNGGAQRKLAASFVTSPLLISAWDAWARSKPTQVQAAA